MWDVIVIGSGIGGLAAAASLSQCGRRVLVLEQHDIAGGLTQTFERHGWRFATGVHYIGGVGPQPGPAGQFGRLLAWLSNGELRFAKAGNPYDIVHLGDESFGVRAPEDAYRDDLLQRFPNERAQIDAWFADCAEAQSMTSRLFATRALPALMAWAVRQWRGGELSHWTQTTLADRISRIADPQLRALLGARWGDHGAPPAQAPFFEHALVLGSYKDGAYYPVGGPARFAQTLVPIIEAAGGHVRCGADVRHIDLEQARVAAVRYRQDGAWHTERCRTVISAAGVRNTVAALPPSAALLWKHTLNALHPGLAHVALYLGLEGDIAAAGATAGNHWFYDGPRLQGLGRRPAVEPVQAALPGAGAARALPRAVDPAHAASLCALSGRRDVRHRDDGRAAYDACAARAHPRAGPAARGTGHHEPRRRWRLHGWLAGRGLRRAETFRALGVIAAVAASQRCASVAAVTGCAASPTIARDRSCSSSGSSVLPKRSSTVTSASDASPPLACRCTSRWRSSGMSARHSMIENGAGGAAANAANCTRSDWRRNAASTTTGQPAVNARRATSSSRA